MIQELFNPKVLLGFLLAGSIGSSAFAAAIPHVGQKAPAVQGTDQHGHTWKLADALKKHIVLLYFYPKDDTPGCTKEACGFRDRMSELEKKGVEVVGISFDSARSHRKFIRKYHLNFRLLADTKGRIVDEYGVRMKGRNLAHRVSFLIDRSGIIRHVTNNPSAEVHLQQNQDAIKHLLNK